MLQQSAVHLPVLAPAEAASPLDPLGAYPPRLQWSATRGGGEYSNKISIERLHMLLVVCDDRYHACTFAWDNFAPFLLLTRRCYDAETSAILLLL